MGQFFVPLLYVGRNTEQLLLISACFKYGWNNSISLSNLDTMEINTKFQFTNVLL